MSIPDRLRFVAKISRRRHYPEIIATLICIVALALALALLVNPGGYISRTTYQPAIEFASPAAWAVAFATASLATLGGIFAARSVAMWPVGALAALWGAWASFMFAGAINGGVPSAAVGYTALAWATLALAAVYWTDQEDDHAAP